MKIEKARYVNGFDNLQNLKTDRIYTGSEFCEFLLPDISELENYLESGIPISIQTPIATQTTVNKIIELAEFLEQGKTKTEIIVNDFGVLQAIYKFSCIKPVAGRLLSRNLLDQQMQNLIASSKAGFDYLQQEYGLTRIEISNYRSEINFKNFKLPNDFSISIHHPFHYLSTSRQCVYRFNQIKSDQRIDQTDCAKMCRDHVVAYGYPGFVEEEFYLKGNSTFLLYKKFNLTAKQMKKYHINRIVTTHKHKW